jgi:hypothetical protein
MEDHDWYMLQSEIDRLRRHECMVREIRWLALLIKRAFRSPAHRILERIKTLR